MDYALKLEERFLPSQQDGQNQGWYCFNLLKLKPERLTL